MLNLYVVAMKDQGSEAQMTEQRLREWIVDCLPSVFGPGGRCEVDGWEVCVTAEVFGKHIESFEGPNF